jgi:hypothetical protein
MPPVVLIIEARQEVAAALESTIALANLIPVVVPYLDRLSDIPHAPAAIVVRISFETPDDPPHAAIARLPRPHPPVVAIARQQDEIDEAHRLKCDVVLHAPQDINRLCETLTRMTDG